MADQQLDRASNWSAALEARDRDLIGRVRAFVIEFTIQHGRPPTERETAQAVVDGR